jgi:hypothetical protein
VSSFEFTFGLELPGPKTPAALLEDLTARILEFVGRRQDAAAIAHDLQGALRAGAGGSNGCCSVRFVSREGRLEVAVSASGGPVWHTTRPLP